MRTSGTTLVAVERRSLLRTWMSAKGALDDLLDAAQAVTRTLLGVGVDPASLPSGAALPPDPGRGGWLAYGPRAMPRRIARYGG